MKRFLSAFIAVVMMISVLAGCTGNSTTPSSAPQSGTASTNSPDGGEALSGTLKLWTHQNPAWTEAYQKQIDKFVAQNPGVTIEQEAYPYADFQQKLQTSLVSGDGADIYVIFGSWAADFMPTGALSKVPEGLSATMKEDYYPSATGGFTYNGEYYGFPLEFNIEYGGMIASKKLFDEKNLTYPTTWAELEKIADATSVRNGEIMDMRGFEFVGFDSLPYLFLSMILSNGGEYLNEDGSQVNFTTPEAIDAMTKLVSYVKDRNWTNLDGVNGNYSESGYNAVFKDSAMMAMVGPWAVSQGGTSYGLTYGTDFEYIPLPTNGTKNAFAAETGWGMVVPEMSKQKELAWKFIEWLSQPENLVEHNLACTQLPPCKSVAADPKYAEGIPYVKPLLDILDGGQYIGNFNTDLFKQNVGGMFIDLVSTNKYASVADGLKDMQDTFNALISK